MFVVDDYERPISKALIRCRALCMASDQGLRYLFFHKAHIYLFSVILLLYIVSPTAVNDGSVSMTENEEMWVLEQDQGDGWTRVRKNDACEGFVPTSYVQCHFYDQDAV